MTDRNCLKKGIVTIGGIKGEEEIAYIPSKPYIASFSVKDNLLLGFEKEEAVDGQKAKYANIIRDRQFVRDLIDKSDIRYKYLSCFTLSSGQFMFNGKKNEGDRYRRRTFRGFQSV